MNTFPILIKVQDPTSPRGYPPFLKLVPSAYPLQPNLHSQRDDLMNPSNQYLLLANGQIKCRRCQAKSKRTQEQCKAPAMRLKRVCKIHGGLSFGPKTFEGKKRIAIANTCHGHETRAIRKERSLKSAEMSVLENWMYQLQMTNAPKRPGRKSSHYKPRPLPTKSIL